MARLTTYWYKGKVRVTEIPNAPRCGYNPNTDKVEIKIRDAYTHEIDSTRAALEMSISEALTLVHDILVCTGSFPDQARMKIREALKEVLKT